MFFAIISISIYIFGIYLILVLSNCNAIAMFDILINYLSIYLSIYQGVKKRLEALTEGCRRLQKVTRG